MNVLELGTAALLIALLSGKVLIGAYGGNVLKKKHVRILNILVASLLMVFCVIVVNIVVSAVSG